MPKPHKGDLVGDGDVPALSNGGWDPGEPNIAVGSTHIVQTINAKIGWWTKTNLSTAQYQGYGNDFWGTASNYCIDWTVQYLASRNRFTIACWDLASGSNVVRFAVSKTSDPNQGWWKYTAQNFNLTDTDPGGGADQPKINVTADKFIVSGDASMHTFKVYPLTNILAGQQAIPKDLSDPQEKIRPAVSQGTNPGNNAYYVYTDSGRDTTLYTIATVNGTPTLSKRSLGPSQIAPLPPTAAPAIPSAAGVNGVIQDYGNYSRAIHALSWVRSSDQHRLIGYSGHTGCVGVDRYCAWYQVYDLTANTVDRHTWGVTTGEVMFPTIAVDSTNNVYLSYIFSSPTVSPGLAVTGPSFNTSIQQADPGAVADGTERYGDFYNTAQDPSDPTKVWLTGAYMTTGGGWNTAFAKAGANGLQ